MMSCSCCKSQEIINNLRDENNHLRSIVGLNKDHIKSQEDVIKFLTEKNSNLERKLLGKGDVE